VIAIGDEIDQNDVGIGRPVAPSATLQTSWNKAAGQPADGNDDANTYEHLVECQALISFRIP
jgi:hypothetical protein